MHCLTFIEGMTGDAGQDGYPGAAGFPGMIEVNGRETD